MQHDLIPAAICCSDQECGGFPTPISIRPSELLGIVGTGTSDL